MERGIALERIGADAAGPLRAQAQSVRIVCFDIDGTLVNAAHEISDQARSSVASLRSRGIRIAFASGRPYFSAKHLIAELGIDAPSVFFSGAAIVDPLSGTVLHEAALPAPELSAAIELFRRNNIYCELYSAEDCFIEAPHPYADIHAEYLGRSLQVTPFEDVLGTRSILKIVAVAGNPEEDTLMRTLLCGMKHVVAGIGHGAAHPHITFANLTSVRASRDVALDKLVQLCGVSLLNIAAFGDGEADIPFLERVGFGIAMGNAVDSVKARARFVTRSVEDDGVAFALKQLGII